MPNSSSAEPAAIQLWQFVSPSEYLVPNIPARSAIADAIGSIRTLIRSRGGLENEAPLKQEADLLALDEVKLAHLVPPVAWADVASSLDEAVGENLKGVKFIISQPFNGASETLRTWAEQHDATIIEPPSVESVLSGDTSWLEQFPEPGELWVLPELERWYLRHVQGLGLVRKLLNLIETGQLGIGLVGVDSWAVASIATIWPMPHRDSLTLQAFDGLRLQALFASMVAPRPGMSLLFRNARRGHNIMKIPVPDDNVHIELVELAGYCRGNVGTAITFWRQRLRSEPEAQEAKETDDNLPAAAEEHIWVTDNEAQNLPMPAVDENMLFVLHALLLHNGLPEDLLTDLLPIPFHRYRIALLQLRDSGVIKEQDGRWYVTAVSYMAVRSLLRSRKFLTDNF